MSRTPHQRVILDMDSSENSGTWRTGGSIVQRSLWEVHHPLFVFNQFGDCEGATMVQLRAGNHTHWLMYWIRSCLATGRQECGGTFVPMPTLAKPDIYEYLEARHVRAIRLPGNEVLQRESPLSGGRWAGRRSVL